MQKVLLFGSALLAALPVSGQQAATPGQPAGAGATPPAYRSVFDGYRPWRDTEPLSWRKANDDAAALGGHMGHVRGMVERAPAAPTTAVPPASKPGTAR